MVRVRFAPSPTGYLHIGNVRTALFNYLFAKSQGGAFILRIEDTDAERSKPEFLETLMRDLRWMGLEWDEGPEEVGGSYGPYLQSQRLPVYRKYVDTLLDQGKAYYCYVTEEEAEELRRIARLERRPPRFDNRGRYFSATDIEERKARGIRPTVRFRIENPRLEMQDLIRGHVAFNLDEMVGDFVIQRADGMPTFHLAVCVDDGLMNITHVIRGEDHLSNTPKHILLLEAMGFKPPQYGHLSLIHGPGGTPLSKRLESVSIRQFRKQGYLPEAVANYLALLGWSAADNREIFHWEELKRSFTLSNVNKSASIFDSGKLDWVNGQHLRLLSDQDFAERAISYLKGENLMTYEESLVRQFLPVLKDNIEHFDQLPDKLDLLKDEISYENPLTLRSPESREVLQTAVAILSEVGVGTSRDESDSYDGFVNALKKKVNVSGKRLFVPIRLALTGREHGPELKRIFPVLGMKRIRQRLVRALEF